MIHELDVVILKSGNSATILECYDNGSAFLAEIFDDNNRTIDVRLIYPDEISEIIYQYKAQ